MQAPQSINNDTLKHHNSAGVRTTNTAATSLCSASYVSCKRGTARILLLRAVLLRR